MDEKLVIALYEDNSDKVNILSLDIDSGKILWKTDIDLLQPSRLSTIKMLLSFWMK